MAGRWAVTLEGEDEPVFIAESLDGHVSFHIPSPDPVVLAIEKAEEIHLVMGVAIGNAHPGAGES